MQTAQRGTSVVQGTGKEQLVFPGHLYAGQAAVPHHRGSANPDFRIAEGTHLVVLFQFDVQRSTIAMHLSFQGANGLVVLHHLNGRYGFDRHVLRSLVVLVAHQVQPLNIHLIDAVALIHNLSGQHFDAGHVLEHVLDTVVFLLAERLHMVIECIFLAGNGVGLHHHFVNGVGLFDKLYVITQLFLFHRNALGGKAHFGKGQLGRLLLAFQDVLSITPADAVCQQRILGIQYLAQYIGYAFAVGLRYRTLKNKDCFLRPYGHRKQKQEEEYVYDLYHCSSSILLGRFGLLASGVTILPFRSTFSLNISILKFS